MAHVPASTAKSAASAPVRSKRFSNPAVIVPVFITVKDAAGLVVPNTTLPKSLDAGVRVRVAAAAGAPVPVSTVITLKPAGEEITYDYQYEDDKDYTEKDYLFYGCVCGARNCRGTIVKTRRKWRS